MNNMEEKPFLFLAGFDAKMNILINKNRCIVNHLMNTFPDIDEAIKDKTMGYQNLSYAISLYKQQREDAEAEQSVNNP